MLRTRANIWSLFCLGLLVVLLTACSMGAPQASPLLDPSATITLQARTPLPGLYPSPEEEQEVAALAAAEGLEETPSATETATQTATATPAPSLTPWPTLPPPPTLIPALPQALSQEYSLAQWSVERAAEMVALVQLQRDLTPVDEVGNYSWAYYAAWQPVALALQEAVLRFPDDPAAGERQWAAAYALAQYGANPQAAQAYASLISEALNMGQVNQENLPNWFRQRQRPYFTVPLASVLTHLELLSSPLRVPGFPSSYLINLQDGDQGGLCFVLLEKNGVYQAQVIFSSLIPWNEPRLAMKNIVSCSAIDVDGDGWDEVLATKYEGGNLGTTYLQIYSLDRMPPHPLPFGPEGLEVFQVGWGGYQGFENQDGQDYLKYSILPSKGCNILVSGRSRWNGEWFEPARISFDFRTAGDYPGACLDFIAEFASQSTPAIANDLLDGAIRHWFRRNAGLDQPDQLDELRVMKGLYLAYEGRVDSAAGTFAAVSASPTIHDSIWVAPAQEFLQTYHTSQDIYLACQTLQVCRVDPNNDADSASSCEVLKPCDSRKALKSLVSTMSSTSLPGAIEQLRKWGVPVQTAGWIDMDGDGLREAWFTLRHPGDAEPEVWALARWGYRLKALRFENAPLPLDTIRRYETKNGGLVLINGFRQYEFKRLEATGEPFLLPVPSYPELDLAQLARNTFDDLREALYAGADPSTVYTSLLEIENWRRFQCDSGVEQDDKNYCPDYYYTLGLAAELAGDTENAVQAYHQVWREYSDSLYGLMARLKLKE